MRNLDEDLGITAFVGVGQGGTPDRARTQVIVLMGMAVEAGFKRPQAAHAGQLGIHHGDQVIPTAKALAVLVGAVFGDQSIEDAARQRF
ncbi:hypothetical protein AO742_20660 [Pseudomonas citronellolis]|nr:hypothetical protein AO742_20660 [Pseudomonas citronellolis]